MANSHVKNLYYLHTLEKLYFISVRPHGTIYKVYANAKGRVFLGGCAGGKSG